MNNYCTVLVSSCDKYSEAWSPFFQLFRKYWASCEYDVYLNTETKNYSGYNVKTVNSEGTWGERLYGALAQISTPYVLIMLEDFFLQREVNDVEINKCIDLLNSNTEYACFYLKRTTGYDKCEVMHNYFYKMEPIDDESLYFFNCQAAIWRKDVLMEAAKRIDTPWEFEVKGYEKCQDLVGKYSFFCHTSSYYDYIRDCDVMSYILVRESGMGIYRSKWLWNNKKFFKKEGINFKAKELKKMTRTEFLWKERAVPFLSKARSAIIRKIQ